MVQEQEKIKVTKTSYSALETFKQCPQKYKFKIIDKIKVPKLKEAVFGNTIHETLKYFHSTSPVSPTLNDLLNYYKEIWNSEPFDEQEDLIYFSEGVKMLKNYYQHFLKEKDKFVVLDTESRFEIPIENPETGQKCTLVGIIDRIDKLSDGSIRVVDYKTTKRLPSQTEADKNLQFSLYCLAVLRRWPKLKEEKPENIKLSFHYLKHNEILTTQRTQAQLKEVEEEVWQRISEIEKSDFRPTPSVLCDWCGYKNICPMWKHKYSEPKVEDQEVKQAIEEFLNLKEQNQKNNQRIKELKELINKYLDQQGLERVFSKLGYITRLSSIRYSYDLNKIKEILEPLGKWGEVITIDQEKLKKLLKLLPKKIQNQIEKTKKIEKKYLILKISKNKIQNKNETKTQ